MTWALPPQALAFAGFLAERLELERVAVVGHDRTPTAPLKGITVSFVDPSQVDGIGQDCLPLFVAPRNPDRSVSETGSALLKVEGRHQLALVVSPPLDDPSVKDVDSVARWLALYGLNAPLVGDLPRVGDAPMGTIALIEDPDRPLSPVATPPKDFSVVAFVPIYNEIDILEQSIDDLNQQGVQAYVLDNWSTDGSYELAASRVGRGVVGIERTPIDGPPPFYDYRAILSRIEKLATKITADWYVKHDVDEVRRSPWVGSSLREAIYRADVAGYNRIDFTVANFPPTDNGFEAGSDFVGHFRHFVWGHNPGHFVQQKAWKDLNRDVSIAANAGHLVEFEGARTHPYKFLLRHYPIRSQEHGERKVFRDRKPRISTEELKKGWHTHYDRYEPGHSFLADPDEIEPYDIDFHERYLIERLSGVGIERLAPIRRPES